MNTTSSYGWRCGVALKGKILHANAIHACAPKRKRKPKNPAPLPGPPSNIVRRSPPGLVTTHLGAPVPPGTGGFWSFALNEDQRTKAGKLRRQGVGSLFATLLPLSRWDVILAE